jgi:hypothetical protein
MSVVLDHGYSSLDWADLKDEEKKFLSQHVRPHLGDLLRYGYRTQQVAKVDLVVAHEKGRRVVEIKSYRGQVYRLDSETEAKTLLQVFRYALAVRKYGLEGIEYLIEAPKIDPKFEIKLLQALQVTGIPFEFRHENGTTKVVGRHQLDPLGPMEMLPDQRTRPLPPLPSQNGDSIGREKEIPLQPVSEAVPA